MYDCRKLNVTGDYLTDYEIDLLLNGSENDVAAYFVSDYAIAKDGNIYSPKWIYNHTANEYTAVGITPQQVNEKIDLYAQIPFSNDARTSFENKLSDFVGEKVSLSDNTKTTTPATTTAPLGE